MYLCEDGHEQIIHDTHNCPLCAVLKDLNILTDEITELKKQIDILEES